jgi:hypothetical protein
VSDALSGKTTAALQPNERITRLIKENYKGRRDTITGIVLLPSAAKLMALLILFGLPAIASFFIVSWMMIWGISALAVGLGKWVSSSGEMRALGYQPPKSRLWSRAEKKLGLTPESPKALASGPSDSPPPAASFLSPGSATEQTTRTLEEPKLPARQSQ